MEQLISLILIAISFFAIGLFGGYLNSQRKVSNRDQEIANKDNTIIEQNNKIIELETRIREREASKKEFDDFEKKFISNFELKKTEKDSWEKEKDSFLKDRIYKDYNEKIKAEYALGMRGKDNEIEMQKLIKTTHFVEGDSVIYNRQLKGYDEKKLPDAQFFPTKDTIIVADAKCPLTPFDLYFEALEENDSQKMEQIKIKIAEKIKEHIEKLSEKKYHKAKGAFDYVLMFLPSDVHEQIVREAGTLIQKDLCQYAYENNILVSGPRNFLSDLGWAQKLLFMQKNNEVTEEAFALLNPLFKNLRIIYDHLKDMAKSTNTFVTANSKLNSAFSGYVMNSLRDIKKKGINDPELDKVTKYADELDDFDFKQVAEPKNTFDKLVNINRSKK